MNSNTYSNSHIEHNIDLLYGQFLISRNKINLPPSWKLYQINGLFIYVHEMLKIAPITSNGNIVGIIIGCAMDINKGSIIDNLDLHCVRSNFQSFKDFEKTFYALSGRYVGIISIGAECRLYMDPIGSLAAVYSQKDKIVGSTTSLIRYITDHLQGDELTFEKPAEIPPNQYYPAGLTSHPEISRCLPNHYLCLKTFKAIRHWPEKAIERIDNNLIDDSINTLAGITKKTLEILSDSTGIYCPLSAGKESRIILACSKEIENKEHFTFDYRLKAKDRIYDTKASRKLAKRFKLKHSLLTIKELDDKLYTEYLYRIGFDANSGKSKDFYYASQKFLDMDRSLMVGFGGPDETAQHWLREPNIGMELSGRRLVEHLNLDLNNEFIIALENWKKCISYVDNITMLDLLTIENKRGSWIAPQFYGFAPFRNIVNPFNNREFISTVLTLPVEYRKNLHGISNAIINTQWPELLSIPYNFKNSEFTNKFKKKLQRMSFILLDLNN